MFLDVSIKPYCSKAGQDWGQKGSVSGQCGLGLRADRMRNWIFLPTLSCVFSTTGMLGESLGVRRRGKAAQYWNITSSTHIRSTRDADDTGQETPRSFPIALPPGSLFSVSLFVSKKDCTSWLSVSAFLRDCDKCFQLQRGGVTKYFVGLSHNLRHSNAWIQILFHIKGRPDWQTGGNWWSVGKISSL